MSRPTGWELLGLGSDPTPGDPDAARTFAGQLRAFAQDVLDALDALKGLNGHEALQDWVGQAGAAFQQNYGDLPEQLPKLYNSYDMAATALEGYWPKLAQAQAAADAALATAVQNPHDAQVLASSRQSAEAAGEYLSAAAATAAEAVAEASAAGIPNLDWIQRLAADVAGFLGDVRSVANLVSRIADDVAPVLSTLAAVAAVIPGAEVIAAGLEVASEDTEEVGKAAQFVSGYASEGIAGADLVQGKTHEAAANYQQGQQTLHDAQKPSLDDLLGGEDEPPEPDGPGGGDPVPVVPDAV